ncbi:MAG TPA: hypothetical protein DHW34_02350 [Actinobacteria bacterium]|nr:hypothetical protein [Actinomycetota bacterium]
MTVELTDEQWEQARRIARAKAGDLVRGDAARQEDLAQEALERLLRMEDRAFDDLDAFVRQIVTNLVRDDARRQKAAYRMASVKFGGFDAEDLADLPTAMQQLFQELRTPSLALIRDERQQARHDAYLLALSSLPPRRREVVRMAAEGRSHQQIAEELGYANASTVKTTLNQCYKKLREILDLNRSDYFGGTLG